METKFELRSGSTWSDKAKKGELAKVIQGCVWVTSSSGVDEFYREGAKRG